MTNFIMAKFYTQYSVYIFAKFSDCTNVIKIYKIKLCYFGECLIEQRFCSVVSFVEIG